MRDETTKEASGVIERLLFVADFAVAEVDDLPVAARAVFDAAAQVYVVTPSLPGRLAWLADDVDRYRHRADERLDAVLARIDSLGAHATGAPGRGSRSVLLGSVSRAVLQETNRPTLIVRPAHDL